MDQQWSVFPQKEVEKEILRVKRIKGIRLFKLVPNEVSETIFSSILFDY